MKKTTFEIKLPPPGEMVKLASGTDARQVGQFMAQLCRQLAADDPVTISLAKNQLDKNPNSLKRFAQIIYSLIYFEPDPMNRQLLRTPLASLRDSVGNCVDYSILLGSVARAAGLPVVLRLVKFKPETDFVHVYPVINGVPIDLVMGQSQDGSERQKRRKIIFDHFGEEVESFATFDIII
jgi:hypothetical protein